MIGLADKQTTKMTIDSPWLAIWSVTGTNKAVLGAPMDTNWVVFYHVVGRRKPLFSTTSNESTLDALLFIPESIREGFFLEADSKNVICFSNMSSKMSKNT